MLIWRPWTGNSIKGTRRKRRRKRRRIEIEGHKIHQTMRNNWFQNVVLVVVGAILIASCDSNKVYQDFTDFDQNFWHQDSVVNFRFKIEDTSQTYNLITLLRNSQQYPYHNMYYQYTLKDQNNEVLREELKQMFLFDPKTGAPNGGGVGDIFDNSQVVVENYTFPSAGEFEVSIRQYMRLDTLPFVLSVGWRVETPK
jgi:gliding motility-associated lipoprotein GldH